MNLEGLKKSMKHQEGQSSVKKYIVLFILLVLVVIFIVLKGADIESVWNAMKNADPKWLTAGLGLAAVFNIAEGINLRKVLVSFGYRVSFKEAMKYAYIGYFFSSVTPSATGGQPLQLYAMSKIRSTCTWNDGTFNRAYEFSDCSISDGKHCSVLDSDRKNTPE